MNEAEKDTYIKTLQEEIARKEADKRALLEEFKKPEYSKMTAEQIREKMIVLVGDAVITIKEMMDNAEKESVRFSAAKYVIDVALREKVDSDGSDAINKLFEQLRTG